MAAKLFRWLGYGIGALLALLLVAAAWIWFVSARAIGQALEPTGETLARPTPLQIADAPRQARILGCISCHGEGLRGRLFFDEDGIAQIWAPNLTFLAGRASDQQLAQAIRQGIGADGRPLWAMPSPMYSRLSDQEVAALIHYMRALPPGGEASPQIAVGPVGRLGIALGRFRSAPAMVEEFRIRQPYDVGPEHAAGRKLVSVACSECHGADLGGGSAGPDAQAPDLALAGAYDPEQFRALMRGGAAPSGRDLGLMKRVAIADFSHYTDAEIGQIHAYLRARAERTGGDPPP